MSKMSFNGKDLGVEEEKVEVEVQDTNTDTNEELCQEEFDRKGMDIFDSMMEELMKDFIQQMGKTLLDVKEKVEKVIPKLKKIADKNKKKYTIKLTREELGDCITALDYTMACINEDINRCRIK